MKYHLVATLGPTSAAETIWIQMVSAGVNSFRINTSHLSLHQLHTWLDQLIPCITSLDPQPGLVLDLQGSKWRLGTFTPFELIPNQTVELVLAVETSQVGILPVPHPDFFKAVAVSSPEVVLNDAKSRLQIERLEPERILARVVQGGLISPHKGITFSASEYRQETLSEKDRAILAETRSLGFVRYAISYVRDAAEMEHFRALAGPAAYLVAKLERQPALDSALQIAKFADELWLCRGDLGAELGLKAMAEQVYHFSESVARCPRPVLMAGQVLEHMASQPTPTRSEVCFLHDSLARGYQGFVLSDETAIGQYPVESCRIARLFAET